MSQASKSQISALAIVRTPPRAMKPPRLETALDADKLRAQLGAVALDCIGRPEEARARALKLLHGALFRGRLVAQEYLEAGGSGLQCARLLSRVQDAVIRALYDFAAHHVLRVRNPTEGERLAVLAVGGYGRGELAPSSDIDLLFLRPYKQTAFGESMIEFMLYMLWDMGLKIGHSSRSLDECLKLAREDVTIRTAVMEARPLCGPEALGAELERRFWRELAPGSEAAFVAAKLAEREERLRAIGQSRFMVEPNVKDGKGGLRDLHVLFWIATYVHRARGIDALAAQGAFTAEEGAIFARALDYLWTVRCHLHFLTGRGEDRLTFDVQPELAQRTGFVAATGEAAVQAFMRDYFRITTQVGGLTRILCAKLEAEEQKKWPLGLSRFFSAGPARGARLSPDFTVEAGRLAFARSAILAERPILLLNLFAEADRLDMDIHPGALASVSRHLRLVGPGLRADPAARAAFLAVAASPRAPARTLRLMNETGLLGRFLPEFGAIVARTQFNMYHSYTVDEHSLGAVQVVSDIERGGFRAEHPLASTLFPLIQNRRALYLAMLLHDTGKGEGDQEIEGAKSAEKACRRLGLAEEETALVAWLVGHHLRMSETAQKRDLADPRTIAQFADLVATPERLRLLLILTVADMRAVGPNVFNAWKGQLLRDLYRLTEAALRGGRADESEVAARLAGQAAVRRDEFQRLARAHPAQAGLEDSYWLSFDDESLRWHAAVLADAPQAEHGAPAEHGAIVAWRDASIRAAAEFLIVAPDRKGLFADLAAAFAGAGASVAQASAYTSAKGLAFDLFAVQNVSGQAFGTDDPSRLSLLATQLRAAAAGQGVERAPVLRGGRREAAFLIDPTVVFDNASAGGATIVEITGRDRPGLLCALARVFAVADLSIRSAHIGAFGSIVSDAFYVTDAAGAKITEPARQSELKTALIAVLAADEPDAPQTPARRPLARARVSADR